MPVAGCRLPVAGCWLLAAALALCGVSCEQELYNVTITNSTAKAVSYTYNGSDDTLRASASTTYAVRAYTQPPHNVRDNNNIASIAVKGGNDTYTFTDAKALTLKVMNTLPDSITITAGNYIEKGTSTTLTISANATDTSAKIYTRNPRFETTSPYPGITFNYVIDDNTMSVTVTAR